MAPSISSVTGTLSHGSSLVIAGADFGTKATAAPKLWDDFEAGTLGEQINGEDPVVGPTWGYFLGGTGVGPYYDAGQLRGVSTKCSLHNHHDYSAYSVALEYLGTHSQYFFSFWRYYDLTGDYSRNVKPFVLYGNADDEPLAYTGWGDPGDGDGAFRTGCIDGGGSADDTLWGSHPISETEDAWVRYDIWLVQSSVNTQDGRYQVWTHRPGIEVVQTQMSDTSYRTRTSSNYWRQLLLGMYSDNSPSSHSARVYLDDVYIDDTPQRIEIGNASTWAGCTWREIQRPTAWADGSITCVLNKGAHTDLSTTYLYVVDSTNAPSAGFALSEITPPPPSIVWGIRTS